MVRFMYVVSPNVYCETMRELIEEIRAESTVVMFGSCCGTGGSMSQDKAPRNEGFTPAKVRRSFLQHHRCLGRAPPMWQHRLSSQAQRGRRRQCSIALELPWKHFTSYIALVPVVVDL